MNCEERQGRFADDTMTLPSGNVERHLAIDKFEVNSATLLHCMALYDILRTVF